MNSIFAVNFLENPLVLIVLILFAALSSWITQRRGQRGTDGLPKEPREGTPTTGEQERSAGPLNWQDALRQLLGGEPPQAPPPPPVLGAPRAGQSVGVGLGEEQFYAEHEGMNEMKEAREAYAERPPPIAQPLASSRPHSVSVLERITRVQLDESDEEAARSIASQLQGLANRPLRAPSAVPRARARKGGQALSLWRNPRVVRRAFVTSLIFSPPKGLDI